MLTNANPTLAVITKNAQTVVDRICANVALDTNLNPNKDALVRRATFC